MWCTTVNEAKLVIQNIESLYNLTYTDNLPTIDIISIDHDAGDFVQYGGDYIEVLKWMEKQGYRNPPPIRIHSMNVVGKMNMRAIIERNGWTEVF